MICKAKTKKKSRSGKSILLVIGYSFGIAANVMYVAFSGWCLYIYNDDSAFDHYTYYDNWYKIYGWNRYSIYWEHTEELKHAYGIAIGGSCLYILSSILNIVAISMSCCKFEIELTDE